MSASTKSNKVSKKIRLGTTAQGDTCSVELSLARRDDGVLTLSMVGDIKGGRLGGESGGQNYDTIRAELVTSTTPKNGYTRTRSEIARILDLWERWHLNDMNAGCEHQRAEGIVTEKITLTPLKWGVKFYAMKKAAESGEMDVDTYTTWRNMHDKVYALTINMDRPMDPTLWGDDVHALINADMVQIDDKHIKTEPARHVPFKQHSQGLLSKPCATCGYKYGNGWLTEVIPDEVVTEVCEIFGIEVPA